MVNATHSPGRSASGSLSAAQPVHAAASGGQVVTLALAWLGVGLPLAWGVLETLRKALALFQ
jgi:hypothetical protein